jgi:transcriptional regulator with XRE-family HTH domain
MSSPSPIDYSLAPPDEPDPALGRVIRGLRKEQKLSQAELAERSGVAAATVSRIESGQIDPQWATVEKLASGLGVSMKRIGTEVAEQND